MKKIKIFAIAITYLILSTNITYAQYAGSVCKGPGECGYGLRCDRIDPQRTECVRGPGQGGNCSGMPADYCGNGFTCISTPTGGRQCSGTLGAPSNPTDGVNIAQSFMTNFTNGSFVTLGSFVSAILGPIYTLALLLVLIYLVWGSYRYMLSGGDPKAAGAARAHLTWAIIGMIIIFLSYGLFQIVNSLVNNVYN